MLGILSSGPLVARFGARPLIIAGTLGVIASMPTIGLGSVTGAPLVVAAGLFVFGLGMGGSEIAMNVEGGDIEKGYGRPVLPALHGFFSLGTVVGATAGIAFTALRVSVLWHLLVVGAIATVMLVAAMPHVSSGVGIARRDATEQTRSRRFGSMLSDRRLLLIGVVVLAMAFAEGSANDWLPLIMVDGHGLHAAFGSAVYAVFAASMTIGRFAGGPFIRRFGRPAVLCASAISGVVGLAVVIFVDHQIAAGAAVVLWGLGASLGFPVALSVAGSSGSDPAARVAVVATVGYVAFLVGPPLLGFVGEHLGLRAALTIPLVLVAIAIFLAPHVAERRCAEPERAASRGVTRAPRR